jgi:hypothetical protein
VSYFTFMYDEVGTMYCAISSLTSCGRFRFIGCVDARLKSLSAGIPKDSKSVNTCVFIVGLDPRKSIDAAGSNVNSSRS